MDRRNFLLQSASSPLLIGAGVGVVGGLSANGVLAAVPEAAHAATPALAFDCPPVLQNPARDGMTVVAAVNAPSAAWVEFGTTEALGQRAEVIENGMFAVDANVHNIRIAGLKPSTRYFYRVVACPIEFKNAYDIKRGEPVATKAYSFTTLDEGSSAKTSFSIINDTHEVKETVAGLSKLIQAKPADFTIWNGDLVNDVRSDRQIVEQIMRPAGEAFASHAPFLFVGGNHDVRGVHARSLGRYLDLPSGHRFYTLRQGPIAFVVLDTGEDKPDTHPVLASLTDFARYRDVQRHWLQTALKDESFRSAPFRVGLAHIPFFGQSRSDDSRTKWHDLLSEARIDLLICGHVHQHKYTPPDADHAYGQLVGGGPIPNTATFIRAEADDKHLEVAMLDLAGKELGNYSFKRQ